MCNSVHPLLCRAIDPRTEEYVFGYPLFDTAEYSLKKNNRCVCPHDGSLCYMHVWNDELHEYEPIEVDPNTVSRNTGVTDEGGDVIFENDYCCMEQPCFICYGSIHFRDGAFVFDSANPIKGSYKLCDIKKMQYRIRILKSAASSKQNSAVDGEETCVD